MRENRDKLEAMLQELQLQEKNCSDEICRCPEGKLYLGKSHGVDCYYHATESDDGGFARPKRTVIKADSDLAKALAHKKFMEQMQRYLRQDIRQIKNALQHINEYDAETFMQLMPRAYKGLPPEYYQMSMPNETLAVQTGADKQNHSTPNTQTGGWRRMDSGIIVPESLITAAKQGILTKEQKEEIRQIQREWAAQDYEVNTKNLEQKNKMTSRGLMTRSLSEASIIERLYNWDIPFRYDQVIKIGTKTVSPDLSFLSITRGVICWEHKGMTHIDSYIEYQRYKRKLYESAGFVPWENYIETYNEQDGFLDIRMIDAIIENTLLRWLHLD